MNKTVSIIMPAYNSEKYISDAIRSVISQTYGDWELLIVDDGSTDNTGAIIDEYASEDSRIRSWHTENKGVSHARNAGLNNASGEWIVFLDSDDTLPDNAIKLLVENSDGVDMIAGNHTLIPGDTVIPHIKHNRTYDSFKQFAMKFSEIFFLLVFSGVLRKMIRRSIITNKFDERFNYGEDTLFFAKLVVNMGKIRLINDAVYNYRTDSENSLSKQFYSADLSIFEEITSIYINLFESPEMTKKLQAYYLNILVKKTEMLFNDSGLSDSDRENAISAMMNTELLQKTPMGGLPLTPEKQRKAAVLRIGDWKMIQTEFFPRHYLDLPLKRGVQ